MKGCGVIYSAVGKEQAKYLKLANRSAKSLKAVWPNLKIAIYTNCKPPAIYDKVIKPHRKTGRGFLDSILFLEKGLPFKKTVLLDADTYVCCSFPEVFQALGRFDVMGCFGASQSCVDQEIPKGFYELSTSFVAILESDKTHKMAKDWIDMMENSPKFKDYLQQAPFRAALYKHQDIQIGVLPEEYNFIPIRPAVVRGLVKVIHTNYRRGKISYKQLGEKLNNQRKSKFVHYIDPNNIKGVK